MQSLLVLYMTKALLLPGQRENVWLFEPFRRVFGGIDGQPLASATFGAYAASVYLTPILGGFLADRVLGKGRTVLLGAITMAVGHFLMAFAWPGGVTSRRTTRPPRSVPRAGLRAQGSPPPIGGPWRRSWR